MSFDPKRSFDTREGISIKGASGWYSGSGAPISTDVGDGSMYIDKDSGKWWQLCQGTWYYRPNHAPYCIDEPQIIKECEEVRVRRVLRNCSLLRTCGRLIMD